MFAVDDVKLEPDVSLIDPDVPAVMLTADAEDELVINALAPRFTLPLEVKLIVPE